MTDTNMVWLGGELVDAESARLSPFDHGILVGDGVFETLRVYEGVPFAWTRHYERLCYSAITLGLAVPDSDALRTASEAVLAANGHVEARLRITITGGIGSLGSERVQSEPTVLITSGALTVWDPTVTVVTVPWRRNDRGATAGLKTISYAENVRALAYAKDHGAGEAMFLNTRDQLCEATGSNVFTVSGHNVFTPPAASGCLLGVTRALVLELARDAGLATREVELASDALATADEAFLTSTTREVHPISCVDGHVLPAPGPITAQLADAFSALVRTNTDP